MNMSKTSEVLQEPEENRGQKTESVKDYVMHSLCRTPLIQKQLGTNRW